MSRLKEWYVQFEQQQCDTVKQQIMEHVSTRRSMYSVDHLSVLDIPHTAIQGCLTPGVIFSGYINLKTGEIGIHSNDRAFCLRIQLGEVPELKYQPYAESKIKAHAEFSDYSERIKKRKLTSSSE